MAKYAKDLPAGASNRLENVAIVGAGGHQGKHIVAGMLATGAHKKITAITRQDSTNVIPEGVEISKVDYSSQESLVNAMRGHDVLVITMNAMAQNSDAQKNLIDAAATAGIHWILPNEYGYSPISPSFDTETIMGDKKKEVRKYVEEKGISWVAPCCGFWYEYSLATGEPSFGIDTKNKKFVRFGDGNTPITVSTMPQSGRGVAALLALNVLPDNEQDKSLTVSSFRNHYVQVESFTLSQNDMFAAVLQATGAAESDWTIEQQDVHQRWQEAFNLSKTGNMLGFARALYSRSFFPGDNGDMRNKWGGLQNDAFGLPKDDLIEQTKKAIKMAEDGVRYG